MSCNAATSSQRATTSPSDKTHHMAFAAKSRSRLGPAGAFQASACCCTWTESTCTPLGGSMADSSYEMGFRRRSGGLSPVPRVLGSPLHILVGEAQFFQVVIHEDVQGVGLKAADLLPLQLLQTFNVGLGDDDQALDTTACHYRKRWRACRGGQCIRIRNDPHLDSTSGQSDGAGPGHWRH